MAHIDIDSEKSTLDEAYTQGLGRLEFYHPAGTFSLTPASEILLRAIVDNRALLHGVGIDWGSGVGCQAILAAKIDTVDSMVGLEISEDNVAAAIRNAKENAVDEMVCFICADSYSPINSNDDQTVQALKGKVDFVLSNPPSSEGDDGFGYRRAVLHGAREFLKKDGIVFLNISFQYGWERIRALSEDIEGFCYKGVIASTDCVPFDLSRPDLLDCLKTYAKEELNGGADYTFLSNKADESSFINARTALENFERVGTSPLTKWQTHLFEYKK